MHKRPYEKLIAWQESYRLCLYIYLQTREFPREEKFGLTDQMRRAVCSVPLNITEGNAKRSHREKARFLEIALGSLEELHCQSRIALGLKYLTEETFDVIDNHISRVSYLLTHLRSSLR